MLEMGLGVNELFNLFDLQGPVFVGNDMHDENQLIGPADPCCGLRLVGEL